MRGFLFLRTSGDLTSEKKSIMFVLWVSVLNSLRLTFLKFYPLSLGFLPLDTFSYLVSPNLGRLTVPLFYSKSSLIGSESISFSCNARASDLFTLYDL